MDYLGGVASRASDTTLSIGCCRDSQSNDMRSHTHWGGGGGGGGGGG